MTAEYPRWPVAIATHAARDAIGQPRAGETLWPGLVDFLRWSADAGFSGIDLSDSVFPFDTTASGLAELASAAADHGLRFAGLNLLRASFADPGYGADNLDRARRSVEAVALLDAGTLSISFAVPRQVADCNAYRGLDHSLGGSRLAGDRDFEITAERLRSLADEAQASGVALSIEVHHASIADNGASALRLLKLTDHPSVGVNPDLVNAYWAYATPEEDWRAQLRLLAPHANVWHVKNVLRVEVEAGVRSVFLGTSLADGDIDHRWACHVMREAGFTGWVSIERGGPGDALHMARAGLSYLVDDLKVARRLSWESRDAV
jgi:sugar phosphate isomerase/epimerase